MPAPPSLALLALLLLLVSATALSRDRFMELSIRGLYPNTPPLAEFSLAALLPCSPNGTWSYLPALRTLSPAGAPSLCLDVALAAPSPEGGVTGAPPYAGAPAQLRPCNASAPTQLWTATAGGTLTSDATALGAPLCLAPLNDGSGAVGVVQCSGSAAGAWAWAGPPGAWQVTATAEPGRCLAPGGRSVEAQAAFIVGRLAPLLAPTTGTVGLIVDLGWLVDMVTDYTGNASQPYPITATMSPQWAGATYGDIAGMLAALRGAGADAGLAALRIGTLCVGWASIYQVPRSAFSLRHPEVYWVGQGRGPPLLFPAAASPGLHADGFPYAAFPSGVPEGTSFFDFFAAQWAVTAPALGLDTLVVRDGFSTWSNYAPRGGPLGVAASPDPALNAPWFAAQSAVFRAVKRAAPATLVLGYSSAASAVAEMRVGLMDLEAVVGEGWIDGWIDQSWSGAWQDVKDRHYITLGWTFQLQYILAHRAAIAGGNAARAALGRPPCRHYVLHDTFDSYEIWSTIRDVPGKLAWGIWAYNTAALRVLAANGSETLSAADGAYVSWAWSWQQDWLTPANVSWLAAHLGAAQAAGEALQAVYGPAVLYNRAALLHMQATAPAGTMGEWVDEQAGLLAKFGLGVHSVQRADAPAPVLDPLRGDGYLLHAPRGLPGAAGAAVAGAAAAGCPLLAIGAAAALDAGVLAAAGVAPAGGGGAALPLGLYAARLSPAAAALLPGLPATATLSLVNATPVALAPGALALVSLGAPGGNATVLTQRGSVLWWHPSDRQAPGGGVESADLTERNVGSLAPHAVVAAALGALHGARNVSRVAPGSVNASASAALALLRAGGSLKVLAGNLESLNTGAAGAPALPCSSQTPRTPRLLLRLDHVGVPAGRRQAGACWQLADVVPADGDCTPIVAHADASGDEVAFDIYLPPHGGRALELLDCSGAAA